MNSQTSFLPSQANDSSRALVVGTWNDPAMLQGELYDTIVADYLVGAIEGFEPYTQQDILWHEMARCVIAG